MKGGPFVVVQMGETRLPPDFWNLRFPPGIRRGRVYEEGLVPKVRFAGYSDLRTVERVFVSETLAW